MKIISYRFPAWAFLLSGAALTVVGFFLLLSIDTSAPFPSRGNAFASMSAIASLALGLPAAFLGYSMIRKRNWARLLSLVLLMVLSFTQVKTLMRGPTSGHVPIYILIFATYSAWCLIAGWSELKKE